MSPNHAVVSSHWRGRNVGVAVVNDITPGSYLRTWTIKKRNETIPHSMFRSY